MNLRKQREAAHIGVRELARRLGVTGSAVFEIESGARPMPERLAAPWGKAIGLTGPATGRPPVRINLDGLSVVDRRKVVALVAELRSRRAT